MKAFIEHNSQIVFIPDSAIQPCRKPFFVPVGMEDTEWEPRLLTAVRVDRMGKSIAARFAGRYTGQKAVALWVQPREVTSESVAIDGSLLLGPWGEVPDEVEVNGSIAQWTPGDDAQVNALIERVSRHSTLKTGDIALIPSRNPENPDITGNPEKKIVKFKIK
ncbi:MAG: fumarylacetoacetate hydrolase family protein [Bacteroidales bacterium]|nr:fumarylacetoacetate hydrolase family protein [Bacteroidales bacterium]